MQLKGCQKKIVCMRPSDSRLFDEAFFVLREGTPAPAEADMLAEANRILDENLFRPRRAARGERAVRPLLLFLGGGLCASLLWGTLLSLLAFF